MDDPILNEFEMTELLLAAYHGEFDWVQNCIKGGLNIHARDDSGMTPLHWVVDMGMIGSSDEREHIVRFLLTCGADVNATNQGGRSILAVAILAGNSRLVQTLVEAGADVDLADKEGRKPLDVAISNADRAIIDILKKAGSTRQAD